MEDLGEILAILLALIVVYGWHHFFHKKKP